MEIWKLILKTTTDFLTMGDSRGSHVNVLRDIAQDGTSCYIIPATHLKGMIRHEASRITHASGDIALVNAIDRLFGPGAQEGREVYTPPALKITDARSPEMSGGGHGTVSRTHVSISNFTGARRMGGLFTESVIPAGTVFTAFVLVRKKLSREEKRVLGAGLLSASHYGLGSNRSRGLGGIVLDIEFNVKADELKEAMA